MDAFKEAKEMGSSAGLLVGILNCRREIFQSQVDQLQGVVITHCKLTGVNPLAQGNGKRPRDLKAVNSIKDAISKKGSREISASRCSVFLTFTMFLMFCTATYPKDAE